ncbi:formate dehydrogenase subunit alpha [Sulfoacidibacillus thermotolerans]|uniref:Formate dehydrogenase subunit alpha n=1 Tax=Sulfoacidibacillus thermotolerans TaxID=1765684 RepID=A0A2U3D6Y1_SULT2|nr:formate dehydrogenase subunit alpha [Sulfoacidibacillus thermotolerans]PWI57021.1 formate dehydrogenase subunit alpha [Sulfoacidibacillus thermotolerans]
METKRQERGISVTIHGTTYEVSAGQTILQALINQGIEHPHVCYHPSLGPIQTCDTCMVIANGELVRACSTPLEDGMQIEPEHPFALAAQKEAMDRILENHMLYCTVCDNNNGNCTLHNTAHSMGIKSQQYPYRTKGYEKDFSNPFYRYDPDQCILCGRCVEACQDLQVNETLSIDWEREQPRVIWDDDVPIDESSCVSCGHCVTLCPTNALMEKSMLGQAGFMTGIGPDLLNPMIDLVKQVEPSYDGIFAISEIESAMRSNVIQKTKTVCTFCGVGCSFDVWTKGRHILKVEPHEDAPANGVSTCVKGKFGWDFVNSEQRLTKPLIRRNGIFEEASWDEALDLVAEKLNETRAAYGPDAIGLISSSKITNEENYLMQKLARAVIGTNNIDNCSRYCQSPATDGLLRTVGLAGDSGTIVDIANAGLVLVVGANPAEAHPVIATRVKRAQKLRGQKLIVADLRKHELAERANLFIRPKLGTDHVWISALTKYVIDQGWHDKAFIEKHVNGFAEFVTALAPFTLEYAEQVSGITQDELETMAKMIHEADGVAILFAMGVTQHCGGSETSSAISDLLLITGNYGRSGAGAFPLRGHNNVQGACDFGTLPSWFPGYQAVSDPRVRQQFEQAWGVPLSAVPGMDNQQMVAAIEEGRLKAMYLVGEEMAFVDTNTNHVQNALSKLDFLVVQDIFFTKTAQFADVILPASPSLEKEGTFTNTERRIQRLYQVLPTLGESLPDWKIIMAVANRLGANFTYAHPEEIMAEAAQLAPLFAGVTYERLTGYQSLVWPVAPDGSDTPLLYTDGFAFPDQKARLAEPNWIPPIPMSDEFDLIVNNGRLLEHFHEGNMTNKVQGLNHKVPGTFVEVSPQLAAARGISDGSWVRLESAYGAVKVQVVVTDRVQGNELYLPMNSISQESAINLLTSSYTDQRTHTPAYKETYVRMIVLKDAGKSPLPRFNPRFGKRNPQQGVEVQRKWARANYVSVKQKIERSMQRGRSDYANQAQPSEFSTSK